MSEEEKKEIEKSFRAIFDKIKKQLKKELQKEQEDRAWEAIESIPNYWGTVNTVVRLKPTHPEFNDRDDITTDEIIEFSENLRKYKKAI